MDPNPKVSKKASKILDIFGHFARTTVELWICDNYDKLISDEGIAVQDRKCPVCKRI